MSNEWLQLDKPYVFLVMGDKRSVGLEAIALHHEMTLKLLVVSRHVGIRPPQKLCRM
jgi:hypothetical protein